MNGEAAGAGVPPAGGRDGRRDWGAEDPAVSLRDLTFTYRDADHPALRDVTLDLRRGELVVIMGATGAGKTTLARCINGSIPQFTRGELRGEVTVCGQALRDATVSDLAGVVGLVSQDFEAQLFATNVAQEVAFGMEQLGVARAAMQARLAAALACVGLSGFERRDPTTLSGGEKQRLSIAALLALDPAVLILDEPTTDLDPQGKEEVFAALDALGDRGATVVLIEHETSAAVRADRLLLMADGRIVADDRPARLLADVAGLERLGIRPLDLDRLGAACGWPSRSPSIEDAAARLSAERLIEVARPPEPVASRTPLLVGEHLSFAYPDGTAALSDVSLSIGAGEFVALIGQNGSGKTTLAKCLNGLLRPRQGSVRLDGVDLGTLGLERIAARIGYVFQNPDQQIFAPSVDDEMAFALRNFGYAADEIARRSARALAAVGLEGEGDIDPFLLGKGERERLAVASLLALEPSVLILDEPTTGLDWREQRRMLALLAELHRAGTTVLAITHSPWVVAEFAQRAVVLERGQVLFDGPVRGFFADDELLQRSRFRLPDVTRVGRRLGRTALTVEELVASVGGRRT